MIFRHLKLILCLTCTIGNASLSAAIKIPSSQRSITAITKVETSIKQQLVKKGLNYGAPLFIRIFKESSELEIWLKAKTGTFSLFKTYPICTFSGKLGPKLKQGDWQSPEGFYFVSPNQLNPWSRFHLSFNLGYPNRYDRSHNRTGSALMVHGNCVSIGCYAMTDKYIEEIYALINASFEKGQSFFRVHAFPFRLEAARLDREKDNKWYSFWKNLQQGYEHFQQHRLPPNVEVNNKLYVFD